MIKQLTTKIRIKTAAMLLNSVIIHDFEYENDLLISHNKKENINFLYTQLDKMCYNIGINEKTLKKGVAVTMYPAIDIAYYVINWFNEQDMGISNLKLQKILYYIQGEFLLCGKQNGCFPDTIQAWKHGPVVPSVYFKFNCYLAEPIFLINNVDPKIEDCDKKIINSVLNRYKDMDAWEMVEKTHKESPWKSVYNDREQNIIIPIDEMRKFFSKRGAKNV